MGEVRALYVLRPFGYVLSRMVKVVEKDFWVVRRLFGIARCLSGVNSSGLPMGTGAGGAINGRKFLANS